MHTGFDLLCKGYATKYVPVILAKGLCPHTLQTFFNQQHRWCSGSMSLLFSHKFWQEPIGLRRRLTFLSGMSYFLYTAMAVFFAPLPAVLMVWLFPEKVLLWNYVLLIPALLQTFVFLPLWHRQHYGLDAMRTKIVYAWAHVFAIHDRLTGRRLAWNPTGQPASASRRLLLVKILLVAWPLATVGAVVAGSAVNMSSPLDLRFWPPLALAGVYAASAVLVLRPLGETVYREIAPAPAVAQADRVPVGPPAFSPSPVMAASPIEKPSVDP